MDFSHYILWHQKKKFQLNWCWKNKRKSATIPGLATFSECSKQYAYVMSLIQKHSTFRFSLEREYQRGKNFMLTAFNCSCMGTFSWIFLVTIETKTIFDLQDVWRIVNTMKIWYLWIPILIGIDLWSTIQRNYYIVNLSYDVTPGNESRASP